MKTTYSLYENSLTYFICCRRNNLYMISVYAKRLSKLFIQT